PRFDGPEPVVAQYLADNLRVSSDPDDLVHQGYAPILVADLLDARINVVGLPGVDQQPRQWITPVCKQFQHRTRKSVSRGPMRPFLDTHVHVLTLGSWLQTRLFLRSNPGVPAGRRPNKKAGIKPGTDRRPVMRRRRLIVQGRRFVVSGNVGL